MHRTRDPQVWCPSPLLRVDCWVLWPLVSCMQHLGAAFGVPCAGGWARDVGRCVGMCMHELRAQEPSAGLAALSLCPENVHLCCLQASTSGSAAAAQHSYVRGLAASETDSSFVVMVHSAGVFSLAGLQQGMSGFGMIRSSTQSSSRLNSIRGLSTEAGGSPAAVDVSLEQMSAQQLKEIDAKVGGVAGDLSLHCVCIILWSHCLCLQEPSPALNCSSITALQELHKFNANMDSKAQLFLSFARLDCACRLAAQQPWRSSGPSLTSMRHRWVTCEWLYT